MPTNPFDPLTNPIGSDNLTAVYLAGSSNNAVLRLYAETILTQANLDVSSVDAGLGVAITAYQRRLKRNARFFLNQIKPGFIKQITDGTNFYNTLEPGFRTGRPDILASVDNESMQKAASDIFSALSTSAGKISVDARFLGVDFSQTKNAVDAFQNQYDAALNQTIARLDASAQQLSTEIDRLQTEINTNICQVVDGALQAGGAVTELGVGILTTFTSAEEEADPSGDFAVMAIQAGASGVATASQAVRDLQTNNEKLATAYQSLAKIDGLGAIAKAIQVQNGLFINALGPATLNAQQFRTNWTQVETGFSDFSDSIKTISNQEDATGLASTVLGASTIWQGFNARLQLTRNATINQGNTGFSATP